MTRLDQGLSQRGGVAGSGDKTLGTRLSFALWEQIFGVFFVIYCTGYNQSRETFYSMLDIITI